MTEQQAQFFRTVAGPALESERQYSIPAPITIAQAILESGWGKSSLTRLANNYFGVKNLHRQGAGADQYNGHDWQATEFIGGHPERVRADFQAYPSARESFAAHALVLTAAHRYRTFCRAGRRYAESHDPDDLKACAIELGPEIRSSAGAERGYSTDPAYAEKLLGLIRQFRLDDAAVLKAYAAGQEKAAGAAIPLSPEAMA